MIRTIRKTAARPAAVVILMLLTLTLLPAAAPARAAAPAANSQFFPQTGYTVQGRFLAYWQSHGGLAQQGYPISNEMAEVSPLDGKSYSVQYFQRAEFEYHPENSGTPYEVELSPLGRLRYAALYGAGGALNQTANQTAGQSQFFSQTGFWVGGDFWTYWQAHGGLAQQGYPISNEFVETSPLDGKPYVVQYFERAVFERHVENAGTPYEVLLTQLGTIRYHDVYAGGASTPTAPAGGSPPATGGNPPATNPPSSLDTCHALPAAQHATVSPACGQQGAVFQFSGSGFLPGEKVAIWYTWPDGELHIYTEYVTADGAGNMGGTSFTASGDALTGVWAVTMEGVQSHAQAIGYFQVTRMVPPAPVSVSGGCDVSGDVDGNATPSSVRIGQPITINASGFKHSELVATWFTSPQGGVVAGQKIDRSLVLKDGTIGPLTLQTGGGVFGYEPGRWVMTMQGIDSHHQSVVYFCLTQ